MDNFEQKKTPLFLEHKRLGAKLVPFGGWLMPVSYEGVLAEHKYVREHIGVFDVSHMGELWIRGRDAKAYLQLLTINNVDNLRIGQSQYSAILRPDGGMIDDLIIYRLGPDEYLVCVNASNIAKDFNWFTEHLGDSAVSLKNESDSWAQLAIQGPGSPKVVRSLLLNLARAEDAKNFDRLAYTHIMSANLLSEQAYLARTGYTGEVGFELYLPNSVAVKAWQYLVENGVKPIGLGARDTLRLESCYLLYGNDMDETVTPLEAGIGWATKFDCGDFIGKKAIENQKEKGLQRKIFAFKMMDDGIPRHDMAVYEPGQQNQKGKVTSGSVLPTVGGAGGMLFFEASRQVGDLVEIDIRGKRRKAQLVKRPLYEAKTKN